jgi:hypothetical protein
MKRLVWAFFAVPFFAAAVVHLGVSPSTQATTGPASQSTTRPASQPVGFSVPHEVAYGKTFWVNGQPIFYLRGDVNKDDHVAMSDFQIVSVNYGRTGMTWEQGDQTGDGKVDMKDLQWMQVHFGYGVGRSE